MGNIITHNNIGYLNKFMMDFGKAVPKEIPMNLDGKINIDAIEKTITENMLSNGYVYRQNAKQSS